MRLSALLCVVLIGCTPPPEPATISVCVKQERKMVWTFAPYEFGLGGNTYKWVWRTECVERETQPNPRYRHGR